MKIPDKAPTQFGAKTIGQIVRIRLPNGSEREAQFLGRGRFANAFRIKDDVFSFVHHGDESKEILAFCASLKHIPNIIPIGACIEGMSLGTHDNAVLNYKVYKMPYYRPLTAKMFPNLWYWVRKLQKAKFKVSIEMAVPKHGFTPQFCYKENKQIIETAQVPNSLEQALTEINDVASHYDSYLFDDFSKRNLAVDKKGQLILLDVLFGANILRDDIIMRDTEDIISGYNNVER